MGLRFRKSIKLAPGIRLNFSGSGASLSLGPRGASVHFGSKGTFSNLGIPGTGIHVRSRLGDNPFQTDQSSPSRSSSAEITIRVEDDGIVRYLDDNGNPVSDYFANMAKRQQGEKIRELLQEASAKINAETEALGKLHHYTPHPDAVPTYPKKTFETPQPQAPQFQKISLLARMMGGRKKIEARNLMLQHQYERDRATWRDQKSLFEQQQDKLAREFEGRLRTDISCMQEMLETNLRSINWPRETLVSFEIGSQGKAVAIDVDLPEIEHLQQKTASVPERGYKLSLKEIKGKALQELYAQHVHGVGFRIVGEVFASLPAVEEVLVSAFTQRNLFSTGHQYDAYVYSARIPRMEWSQMNFQNLPAIDVVAAFERYPLKRKVARNGMLENIVPFEP